MVSKPVPASLLRTYTYTYTYTSVLRRRTWQLPGSASRLLGLAPRFSPAHAARNHLDNISRRWHSTDHVPKNKVYDFDDVLAILETPSNSRLLIDVREPHEFEKNTIPTAINIPITSQPDALLLDEEDFEDRFGMEKPPLNKEVVFFCKAGVRSSAAAGIARQAGYENIGEYRGSWLDWERRGGPGTKSPPPAEELGHRT